MSSESAMTCVHLVEGKDQLHLYGAFLPRKVSRTLSMSSQQGSIVVVHRTNLSFYERILNPHNEDASCSMAILIFKKSLSSIKSVKECSIIAYKNHV